MYQLFDTRFVVGVGCLDLALCDDAADGHGLVSHQQAEACDDTTFHLVVGDALSLVAEVGDAIVDVLDCNVATKYATLRPIEAVGSDGAATHHVVACDAVDQFRVSSDYVWACRLGRIVDEFHECVLEAEVSNLIAAFVESQDAIPTDGFFAHEESAEWDILLHTATSADTHDLKGTMLVLLGAGGEVDVRQGVEFVEHDIAVVGTNTGRDAGDTLAVVLACDGVELAALDITFDRALVEERSY